MDWTSGAAILAHVGVTAPTADQTAWAAKAAAGTNAAFDRALRGATVDGTEPDLLAEALRAGAERYKTREAPFGVTGWSDETGAAIRVSRDPLEASWPVLRRYATPGIG